MTLQRVLIIALVAVALAVQRKKCDDRMIRETFQTCVKQNPTTVATCETTMKSAMLAQCGVTVTAADGKKDREDAARKVLADCKMAGGTTCDEKFRNATGMTGPVTAKDRVKEKFDSMSGAKDAIADLMDKCTGTKEACRAEIATKLQNLDGKTYSKGELDGEMRKAGKSAAGNFIKDCIANATTAGDKDACLKSTAARDAFAKASGRDASQIKDVDLKKAAKSNAVSDVKDTVRACLGLAGADDTAKKACFTDAALKDKIAGSQGMDASQVKDSRVRDYAAKGARADMLSVVNGCNKTADKASCKEVMKDLKAKSMYGKTAAQITDDDLDKDARAALKADLAEKMSACMEGASTAQDKTDCRQTLAKAAVKSGDMEGREPGKGEVEGMLRSAAKGKASETMKACDKSRDECMAMVKDRVSKVMGKDGASSVTTKDAEVYAKRGALSTAKDSALACVEAKKVDATSTCDDLYTQYKDSRKKSAPTAQSKQNQEKSRLMVDTVAQMSKDMKETCYAKATKALADACMAGFKTQRDEVADAFLRGNGTKNTNAVLNARKQLADRKATTSYLGDRFSACMKESTTPAEKTACATDFDSKRGVAGVNASRTAVLKKFRAQQLSEAATVCNTTDRKACMEAAKQDMIATGMKARQFNMIKKLSELMAAAEVYATCKQADSTDAECEALTQDEFTAVSGAPASVFADVKARIVKIATGIMNGEEIVMKKKMQLLLDALTSGTTCDPNITAALKNKADSVSTTPAFSGSMVKACRLVDGLAEYSVILGLTGFTEAQIDTAADAVNAAVQGSSISGGGRRLASATVNTAYTAQETEACASTDATCGSSDDMSGSTSSSTSSSSTGSATSGAEQTGLHALMILAMLALMR